MTPESAITLAEGTIGVVVRGALLGAMLLGPASAGQSADLPFANGANLLGCWSEDHTAAEQAVWERQMAEPDAELLGMMSSLSLCFRDDGTISSIAVGGFEGREAGGWFAVAGDVLTVRTDEIDDAWYFKEAQVSCTLNLAGDTLHLHDCAGRHGATEGFGLEPKNFTKEPKQ